LGVQSCLPRQGTPTPMALSEATVKNAKPKQKAYKLSDELGMFLLVNPNGSRLWRLKYRFGGKEKLLALGGYPEVSLKRAKEYRDAARQLLKAEKDPATERKTAKRTARLTRRTPSSRLRANLCNSRRHGGRRRMLPTFCTGFRFTFFPIWVGVRLRKSPRSNC
jgi:hypothetical protein